MTRDDIGLLQTARAYIADAHKEHGEGAPEVAGDLEAMDALLARLNAAAPAPSVAQSEREAFSDAAIKELSRIFMLRVATAQGLDASYFEHDVRDWLSKYGTRASAGSATVDASNARVLAIQAIDLIAGHGDIRISDDLVAEVVVWVQRWAVPRSAPPALTDLWLPISEIESYQRHQCAILADGGDMHLAAVLWWSDSSRAWIANRWGVYPYSFARFIPLTRLTS